MSVGKKPGGGWTRSQVFASTFAALVLLLSAAAIYINIANPFGLHRAAEPAGTLEELVVVTASGEHKLKVEIADSVEELSKGLMFRQTMPADQGMLFIHERDGERMMWMKNTYLSLDMVFITAYGKVHRIAERAQPFSEETIGSQGPVRAVLELNAGKTAEIGLKRGDLIRHKAFGTMQ
jgi:uncharacterized protein